MRREKDQVDLFRIHVLYEQGRCRLYPLVKKLITVLQASYYMYNIIRVNKR